MAHPVLRGDEYFDRKKLSLAVIEAKHGDRPVRMHAHDFIELVLFAQGTSLHTYAGKQYRLAPGDLVVIHPGEPHSYEHGRRARIFNCLFLPETIAPDLEYLRRVDGFFDLVVVEPFFRREAGLRDVLHLDQAERLRAQDLLREMMRELERKKPGYEAAARAMLVQLLVLAARAHAARREKRSSDESEVLAGKRTLIRDCIAYIEENYAEEIRLETLAGRSFLSPDHFSKVFKRLTRKTPIEFINSLRVDKAKHLLGTTSQSVTEIAFKTGFHDSNYFARQFKKITKMTPKQYRARALGGYF